MTSLLDQIDALLALDAKGALVPHGIGGLARELLTRSRDALTASQASGVKPGETLERYATPPSSPVMGVGEGFVVDRYRDRDIIEAIHTTGKRMFTGQIGTEQEPSEVQKVVTMILRRAAASPAQATEGKDG